MYIPIYTAKSFDQYTCKMMEGPPVTPQKEGGGSQGANNNNSESDENKEDEISIESNFFANINAFYHSNDIIHNIKLLKILNNIGTPLYAYKSLINWANEASLSNYKFDTPRKMNQQTIKYLE